MDNLQERGPRDGSRISLTEDWEVKWWTKSLGISVQELKEAVNAVGHSAAKVREHLQKSQKKGRPN